MAKRSRSHGAPTSAPLVHWYGEQLASHSLAHVNRQLCRLLVERPTLRLQLLGSSPALAAPDLAVEPALEPLRRRMRTQPGRNPDVTVRHHWPPRLDEPAGAGPLVVCQPWEFGGLPQAWVEPFTDVVDEVWCNSTYVRACYERSGVPAEKLVLVPHGVDTDRFRADGPTYELPTDRSVKLLFVGGTIHRKGIDVLLRSYVSAFRASDDVALVIKGSHADGAYRGSSIAAAIDEIRAEAGAPEVVYLDADLAADELAALYRSCDALVHPYRGEGFGLPVAEAMASGLPVVVTGGGATDDFCDERTALLIPSSVEPFGGTADMPMACPAGYELLEPDGDALVELLRTVAAGGDDVQARAERGRAHVVEHLRWDRSAAIVEERLLALAARPRRARAPRREATPAALGTGVNVVGFLTADFGLGEAARLLVEAIEAAGLPVATHTLELPSRRGTVAFERRGDGSLPHATTVWAVQPDLLHRAMDAVPPSQRRGRRDLAYWFWESELPSPAMHEASPLLDGVWVGSEFMAGAVRQACTGPVHVVAPAIVDPGAPSLDRRDLGLPEDRFLFLFEFDHQSIGARKNPNAALSAYERAFQPGDGAALVLKAINGDAEPAAHAQLRERVASRPDVVLLEERLPAEANHALIAACDAYVSLHRAEGFGLTMAEAMVRGKPVVATGWSGNLDFMSPEVSVLVPYELRRASATTTYPVGTRWAEADIDAAATAMRRLVEDRAGAAALGAAAAEHVAAHHGLAARGAAIRAALEPAPAAPLLSACLIVKDEEAMLGDCLASLDGLVDEVVVYDTGSTDATVAVARAAGARVVEGYWDDDFGRARNAALAECRGTWVLQIDADERFDGDPAAVRGALERTTADMLVVRIDNETAAGVVNVVHHLERLFRRDRAHWQGRLHEQLEARPGRPALRRAELPDAALRHLGYRTDVVRDRGKADRNLAIAEAELAGGGSDAALVLNVARSLTLAGRTDEALARSREAYDLADHGSQLRLAAAQFRAEVLLDLGRADEALEAVADLAAAGESADVCRVLEDRAHLLQGDLGAAARLVSTGTVTGGAGWSVAGDGVKARAALALADDGRWDETSASLLDLVGRSPGLPVWADLAVATRKAGLPMANVAAVVPEPFLRSVLAQLLLGEPEAADELGEALHDRWPGDVKVLAFAVHLAPRLAVGRALEWSARLRGAGLTDGCPLVAIAGDPTRTPDERLQAAAIVHGAFGDGRGEDLVARAASALDPAAFVDALVTVDELAPALLPVLVRGAASTPARAAAMAGALAALGADEQAAAVQEFAESLNPVG